MKFHAQNIKTTKKQKSTVINHPEQKAIQITYVPIKPKISLHSNIQPSFFWHSKIIMERK